MNVTSDMCSSNNTSLGEGTVRSASNTLQSALLLRENVARRREGGDDIQFGSLSQAEWEEQRRTLHPTLPQDGIHTPLSEDVERELHVIEEEEWLASNGGVHDILPLAEMR